MRIKILQIIINTFFAIIVLDLVYTQVIRGPYYHRLSTNNRIRVVPLEGKRGRILDRSGIVIADNRVSFDVMVTPQEMKNKEELFLFLSKILGVDEAVLAKRFQQRRYAPFAPVVIAHDVTREQAFVLEENRFRFPSLVVQENYRRFYPMGEIGSHVLGYVSKISRFRIHKLRDYGYSALSVVGYAGVEESYDQYLKGAEGGLQVEVNSRGQQVRILSIKEPQSGQDIQLTINSRIQQFAFDVMQGKTGAILVMDMDTGEILGMISSPSYDPNIFIDSKRNKQTFLLFADRSSPILNRAVKGLYPPGSVFKIPIAMGALETEKINPQSTFVCKGAFYLGRRQIRCAHTHGPQNLLEAIAHSCNVYFINVGLKLESDLIAKYAKLFGLGQLTRVDLPFEKSGLIPSQTHRRLTAHQSWYKGDTANLSIGQGDVLVTPIQLLRMVTAVSKNGQEVQPHVIKAINFEEVDHQKYITPKTIAVSDATFEIVRQGLRSAVVDPRGTANILDIPGLITSGKTGTAQSGEQKQHHAWFVGYVTSQKPSKRRLSFCVFLEHGVSSYYAVDMARHLLIKMQAEDII